MRATIVSVCFFGSRVREVVKVETRESVTKSVLFEILCVCEGDELLQESDKIFPFLLIPSMIYPVFVAEFDFMMS